MPIKYKCLGEGSFQIEVRSERDVIAKAVKPGEDGISWLIFEEKEYPEGTGPGDTYYQEEVINIQERAGVIVAFGDVKVVDGLIMLLAGIRQDLLERGETTPAPKVQGLPWGKVAG
jgi:hypothetical protein